MSVNYPNNTPNSSAQLLGFHAFTGCNSCSAFNGIGKIKPVKVLQKYPQFNTVLEKFGESWDVSDELFVGAELTCALYGSSARDSKSIRQPGHGWVWRDSALEPL